MPPNQPPSANPSLNLKPADILYVLFRHKWKIAIISLLGIALAAGVFFLYPLPYVSQASLFIKYVVDTRTPSPLPDGDTKFKTPDERGETVILTELAIIQSLDLAREAAANLPAATLQKLCGDAPTPQKGAAIIRAGLEPEVPKKSSVIQLSFKHKDSTIVTEVLGAVIQAYYKIHNQIHRPPTDFEQTLATQNDQLGALLRSTEEQLRNAKAKAGINSLDETKKFNAEEIAKVEDQIRAAQADLADRSAVLEQLAKSLRGQESGASNQLSVISNQPLSSVLSPPSSNTLAFSLQPSALTNEPSTLNPQLAGQPLALTNAPAETQAEYKRLASLLEVLLKKEQDLLVVYTPENKLVKAVRDEIEKYQKSKIALEQQYPTLATSTPLTLQHSPGLASSAPAAPVFDLTAEQAKITGIRSRITELTNQLATLHREDDKVHEAELNISDLERKKAIQEADYKFIAASLQQYRINRELEPGRVSNIGKVQTPSPPVRDTAKLQKLVLMLLFGSVAGAFALAFVIEFYLDHSIKRPVEVETKLQIPLFISIPRFALNGHGKTKQLPAPTRQLIPERAQGSGDRSQESGVSGQDPSSIIHQPSTNENLDPSSVLRPPSSSPLALWTEALRDRLITFFELKNLTHKPKLVALTSCAEGSGVSTIAAGLAASLSETGEGNVLLVDMNAQNGAAHHFRRGDLACGIDEALEGDKRGDARVQENLYVVSEAARNDTLPTILPKRFKNLVPKMKASDFDYIIFDMPPVSQISMTPRLARFMDSVLLVVESEKTDRDLIKRAADILGESKTPVGIVLNKTRSYVPKALAPHDL